MLCRSDGCCRSPVYKLAGVKHTLYHPRLPSLRRMEMDTVGHKLSDSHSRTSTPCRQEIFSDPRATNCDLPQHHLPSLEATDTGRQITQRYRIEKVAPQPPGIAQEERLSRTHPANDWHRYVPYGECRLQDLQSYVSSSAITVTRPPWTEPAPCRNNKHVPHLWLFIQQCVPASLALTERDGGAGGSAVLQIKNKGVIVSYLHLYASNHNSQTHHPCHHRF
ncbi:sperm microtubule inner protein 8 isoform X1 [Pseudophryne corroboree]|uniref:sperm microtubule inner protein 8 isoform X1 n=1 Tax=Pseudophryne corroboree TaxID=495146 RepID=UPI00308204A3